MPEMFKFMLKNAITGTLSGWAVLGLFLFFDVGGIGHAVFSSSNPFLPLALLIAGFTITFASLAMGGAVMLMPYDGGNGNDRGLGIAPLLTALAAMRERLSAANGRKPLPAPVRPGGKSAGRPH